MADDANGYTADVQYEGQAQYSRGGAGAYGAPSAYQGGAGGGGYQGGYPSIIIICIYLCTFKLMII